jgi:mannose-6-phosphate isomerase-like protein (cupin superfamily)
MAALHRRPSMFARPSCRFRGGFVELDAGELYLVPKGLEHKPYAGKEVKLILIGPSGVINAGDDTNERTAKNDVWI